MVRSIKSCSVCSLRFVSHGGNNNNNRKNQKQQQQQQQQQQCDYYLCSRCDNNSSLRGRRTTTTQTQTRTGEGLCRLDVNVEPPKFCSGKEKNNTDDDGCEDLYLEQPPKQASSIVHLTPDHGCDDNENYFCDYDDDDDGDRSGGGSEGGDDFHCTQIIEIIESQSLDDSIDEEATEEASEQQAAQNLGDNCFHNNHPTTVVAEAPSIIPLKTQVVDAVKQKHLLQADNQSQHHQNQTPPLPKPNATAAAATNAAGASRGSGDICFICGADLSRLKRRIDHIKRCSKKHGITGRDVRLVSSSPPPPSSAAAADSTTGIQPKGDDETTTTTKNNNWHGDAEKLLKLTNQDHCQTISHLSRAAVANAPTGSSSKAPPGESSWTVSGYNAKLGKFVVVKSAPAVSATRNLNNVLMAGSRRLEVTTNVANKRGEIELGGGNNNSKNNTNKNNKKRTRYNDWNCPMYKKITGTDFVVDGFHYAKQSLTKNYFLTHFHSDHYGGITSSWDVGTIFCSLPTASLVSQQLRVDKKHIHPLPMNTPTVVESRGKAITVTLLDANHCPGAVMFLFEVGKRTMLHVGDFRWSRDVMLCNSNKDGGLSSSPLHDIVSEKVVLDELYLDTTYCHEKYQLPPQSDTIKATIETFQKELERCKKSSKRTLHLFGAYTIGKEKIYLSVAEHFGLKVYVDKARHRILSTLNLPKEYTKLLTTDRETSNLWVVPMGHLNMKKMPEYFAIANSKPFAPQYDRIVGYRPTGWSLSRSGMVSSRNSGKLAIHSVPYSEHSSYPELVDCLACLKPAKIIPTVNASKSNDQVKLLLQGLRNKQTALKLFSKSSSIKTP